MLIMKIDWNDIVVTICMSLWFITSCGSCSYSCIRDNQYKHEVWVQTDHEQHEIIMKKIESSCK